jgi:hypothetical protein
VSADRQHVGGQEAEHRYEPDFWLSPLKGRRRFANCLDGAGFGTPNPHPNFPALREDDLNVQTRLARSAKRFLRGI